MMKAKTTHTLVLMRCSDEGESAVFAGDLYSGHSFEGSVYHDRASMLDWLRSIDEGVRFTAARAMDELLASSDTVLRSIALNTPVALAGVGMQA